MEVFAGHGVDHVAPDFDAFFAVFVEDGFVELVLVDAGEAIVEGTDVGESACETQSATASVSAVGV